MGGLSLWHWLIVLVIVVLVFGTKRLKNVGQDLGEAVKGFKKGMNDHEDQAKLASKIGALLEAEGAAYDVVGYRNAPPGLRVWCGCTVEVDDIEALTPWLEWAYAEALAALETV